MLGKNAPIGFGPYGYFRTGWYNLPHAVDTTLHAGWAAQAPFSTKANGRVRPLVNVDLFGGAMVPYRDTFSLIPQPDQKLGKPLPTFGFALSIGSTF
ncbi:MAG: hypothetical protein GWP91_11760 [Rhodobacterales bacterium]|nr:hypothetical protein [Rhodobacterales bacterium]